ncbi:conserved hypothetical protein [Brucella melitensis bv. 1 str. Rev.1]|nr:conserved hypothetical protein [Brucella melitensis bv. 1 str. Rev.1]
MRCFSPGCANWQTDQRRIKMAIQTVSDELYRRHEREWAEFRNAVEASETNQKQQGQASGKTSCDSKTGNQ